MSDYGNYSRVAGRLRKDSRLRACYINTTAGFLPGQVSLSEVITWPATKHGRGHGPLSSNFPYYRPSKDPSRINISNGPTCYRRRRRREGVCHTFHALTGYGNGLAPVFN